jgi:2-polyprenyl-3-methyl-5-hydroxy-6-metoxy-1,4-benzoquinol methylase
MRRWVKQSPLTMPLGRVETENWTLLEDDRVLASYPVELHLGKELDVLKLRSETTDELLDYAEKFSAIIRSLYGDEEKLHRLDACPCCRAAESRLRPAIEVYDVPYVRCIDCGHVFIAAQPKPDALFNSFEEEEDLSVFYVDPDTLEMRLRDIVQPKLDWVLDIYQRQVGRKPATILDVGAGGGHFVAGCQRAGLKAEGLELSRSSVRFASEALGVELRQGNYLEQEIEAGHFDLLTFWGVLEYAPDPAAFFRTARRQLLPEDGMLIIEVPRSDSLCLAVQEQFTETVWRHAMPDTHMNLYSDASLATLLHDNGFKPIAAWYFGMDIYELLMQMGLSLKSDDILGRLGHLIMPLQNFVDRARLTDDIVVAAVPIA